MKPILIATLLLTSIAALAQKPDLHAGGAKPSTIPNHETTLVTLPGFHLAGATVTVTGVCTLKSYKIVSDNQLAMMIEGHRAIADKEDGCFLTVHRGSLSAGTYVVVDLTEAEWDEKHKKENAADQARGEAWVAHLGKQWTFHYANGTSEVFTAQPIEDGSLVPEFKNTSGLSAKILTTNDNTVMMVVDQCMRSGTLVNGQVKNGISQGVCKPDGAWTAQQK
jgi:hypothetical protein